MYKRFVLDTTSLISYYSVIFKRKSQISENAIKIINRAFIENSNVLIVVPSICFVEIFDKFCLNEEDLMKIRYEVFIPIKMCPNIEIREIGKDVLKNFITLDDDIVNLENHDKIILSTAIELDAHLITSDEKISKYVRKTRIIKPIIY